MTCSIGSRTAFLCCELTSTKTLTLEYSSPVNTMSSAGFEKIVFTKNDYNSIFESRKIFDNYIDQIKILDKDISDQINNKQLPLLIKEHFYSLRKDSADSEPDEEASEVEPQPTDTTNQQEQAPDITTDDNAAPNLENNGDQNKTEPALIETESQTEAPISDMESLADKQSYAHLQALPSEEANPNIPTINSDSQQTPLQTIQTVSKAMPEIPQPSVKKPMVKELLSSIKVSIRAQNSSFIHSNISKIFQKNEESLSDSYEREVLNICFMLHGLEGSSYDMRNLRSALQIYCPKITFYLSEINEDKTNESIERMGVRFAQEVVSYLEHYVTDQDIKISFIGHSLGGLIVRAAMPYLHSYSGCFQTYVSLATPHLGAVGDKFWVNTGMKLLSRVKNNQSLREMALEDEEGYLLKLSASEGLGWFKNIILVANYDDGYTPYESAKILYNSRNKSKAINGTLAKNIYERLNARNIVKICVHIPNLAKGFDVLVGRQAHVEILENNFLKHLIFSQIKEYF